MKYLFIVNPKSGTSAKTRIIKTIQEKFREDQYKLLYWRQPNQDIVGEIRNHIGKFNFVVAIGGDGTVNAVAQALKNSISVMGIIPCGSGNGLARYLGIPMNHNKAIEGLLKGKHIRIDTCRINNRLFLSTCGLGFDAEVSADFAHSRRRGFLSYASIIIKKMWRYNIEEYEIEFDNSKIYRKALLVSVANSNQYGNNVIIAPHADIQDGIMELIIVNPFPLYKVISLVFKLFTKSIHHSGFVETFQVKKVKISRRNQGFIHFDGEPQIMGQDLNIEIDAGSLNVLAP